MCVSVSFVVISHSSPFFRSLSKSSLYVLSARTWRAFCNGVNVLFNLSLCPSLSLSLSHTQQQHQQQQQLRGKNNYQIPTRQKYFNKTVVYNINSQHFTAMGIWRQWSRGGWLLVQCLFTNKYEGKGLTKQSGPQWRLAFHHSGQLQGALLSMFIPHKNVMSHQQYHSANPRN